MDDLNKQAAQVIKDVKYLTISSITPEGLPWGSPVYTAFDNDLNFYWLSWKENQHSINVNFNSNIFVTICDTSVPEGTGVGIYFTGKAIEVHNPIDMAVALKCVYTRSNKPIKEIIKFLGERPRRVYRFSPTKAWINGDAKINGDYIDKRTELNISEIKAYL